jgi:hypothetical protein
MASRAPPRAGRLHVRARDCGLTACLLGELLRQEVYGHGPKSRRFLDQNLFRDEAAPGGSHRIDQVDGMACARPGGPPIGHLDARSPMRAVKAVPRRLVALVVSITAAGAVLAAGVLARLSL